MALTLTMFIACSGEKKEESGHDAAHEEEEVMIDEGASDELTDDSVEELTVEEDVFGADTDM
jgi:hypothetical protein